MVWVGAAYFRQHQVKERWKFVLEQGGTIHIQGLNHSHSQSVNRVDPSHAVSHVYPLFSQYVVFIPFSWYIMISVTEKLLGKPLLDWSAQIVWYGRLPNAISADVFWVNLSLKNYYWSNFRASNALYWILNRNRCNYRFEHVICNLSLISI